MAKKVLVVDDEASIRRLIQVNLERQGYEVVTASTGAEGIEKARAQRPDMIILDYDTLPDMKEIEFLQPIKLHRDIRDIPILALRRRSAEFRGWPGAVQAY